MTEWDVVLASFVFNKVVPENISEPARHGEGKEKIPVPKEGSDKTAEKRLQRKIKELWKRKKEGGIFVIVEDSTGAEGSSGHGCASGASAAVREAGSGSGGDGVGVHEGAGATGEARGRAERGARVPARTATTEGAGAGSAARQGAGPAVREPTVMRKTEGAAAAAAARVKQGAAAAPRATRAAHARRAAGSVGRDLLRARATGAVGAGVRGACAGRRRMAGPAGPAGAGGEGGYRGAQGVNALQGVKRSAGVSTEGKEVMYWVRSVQASYSWCIRRCNGCVSFDG